MRLAVTPGEPGGIGPDLLIMAAQHAHSAALVAIADSSALHDRAARLGLPLTLVDDDGSSAALPPRCLRVRPLALPGRVECGRAQPAHAGHLLEALRIATQGCLDDTFDAMVTGPLQKSSINEAGVAFSGHTEFLAEITSTPRVVMMLATPGLRVALVTTHLPLRAVPDAITPDAVREVIDITHRALHDQFGIEAPRLKVCGLNPHAGEGGHLGREEIEVIEPVIARCRASGMQIEGPLPADTLFTPAALHGADAVIAMYHDQGLPVLKHQGFGHAVNITLGLPLIRTSVDHGTALALAGTGQADGGSFQAAIAMAAHLARQRRRP